jgi:RNA recognition motif-containing protein
MPISESGRRLFVGNLLYTTTLDDLIEFFSRYGPVTNPSLPEDRDPDRAPGRNKGFGFVTMADPETAIAAVKACHGKPGFGGRKLTVKLANQDEKR